MGQEDCERKVEPRHSIEAVLAYLVSEMCLVQLNEAIRKIRKVLSEVLRLQVMKSC